MNKFLLLLLMVAGPALAVPTADDVYKLNKMNSVASQVGLGTLLSNDFLTEGLERKEHVAMVTYVFGTDGGAVSAIGLGVTLPDNAVVTKVIQDITVDCDSTGDTGTITLGLPTDGAISATTTCDGTNAGVTSTLPSGTPVKLTAARQLTATIATNAVLVGTMRWFVYYVLSN